MRPPSSISLVPPLLAAMAALAGCHDKPVPSPEPTSTAPMASDLPSAGASDRIAAAPPAIAPAVALDSGALHERHDPTRLLRYYAAALEAGDWAGAARAWRPRTGVTAATLRASYDRGRPPTLTFGKGDQEGGAGSLYYQVPVTLRFGSGAEQRGTLTLRRVNDVDGATPEQLDWHIEQSTIGAAQ